DGVAYAMDRLFASPETSAGRMFARWAKVAFPAALGRFRSAMRADGWAWAAGRAANWVAGVIAASFSVTSARAADLQAYWIEKFFSLPQAWSAATSMRWAKAALPASLARFRSPTRTEGWA